MSDGNGEVGEKQIEASLVPAKVESAIKDLPEPKQQEIVHSVQEAMIAVINRGGQPPIDAETAKILSATIEKDNENKFKFLTQKQADSAAESQRTYQLKLAQHKDLMRPCVWAVVLITIAGTIAGFAFIAQGKEAIGSSILTGIFGALLGFLGGLGAAKVNS